MAKVHVFCSHKLEVSYIFRCNNVRADFHNGVYATANTAEITELESEITNKHPDLYLPEEENRIVEEEDLNPILKQLKAVRAQARAELIAEMKAGGVDLGKYAAPVDGSSYQNSTGIASASVLSGTDQAGAVAGMQSVQSVQHIPVMVKSVS